MAKCQGTTAAGNPCKNNAKNDGDYCGAHSGKIGRPCKLLTPEIGIQILELVKAGNYAKVAAVASGISERTYYNWIAIGEEHVETVEDGGTVPESLQLYVDFLQSLKEAEAIGETLLVMDALTRGNGWQAPMTVLERKYPERWGRTDRHEHKHGSLTPQTIEPPSDDEHFNEVAEILAATGVVKPDQ